MMWVAIGLIVCIILVVGFFCVYGLVQTIWHHEQNEQLLKAMHDQQETLRQTVNKLVDGPHRPDPIIIEQGTKEADEEWIMSPESIIQQGDDLSPVFDADEV